MKIGAQDQEIQAALAKLGQSSRSVDADLKKIGNTPLGQAAQQSLGEFNALLKGVTDNQQRLADRAKVAAQGIDAIGGPARLTKAELDKMNRTIQTGIDAYRALGQEAPKDLQKVADAITKQQKTLQASSLLKPTAGGAASGFLGALPGGSSFSAFATGGAAAGLASVATAGGAAFAFAAKQAIDYADSLTKLSDRTGIGTVALQRLESVAEASGNSLDQIGTAVSQFQNRLSSGDKAAGASLREIGLSIAEIRRLSPDEQFFAIAKGIQSIQDPADQVRIAMDLFGKSGAELLPSLKANIDQLKDSTVVMSAESVSALDDLGDAIGRLFKSTKAIAGEGIGLLIQGTSFGRNMAAARRQAEEEAARRKEAATAFTGPVDPRFALPRAGLFEAISATDALAASNKLLGTASEQMRKSVDLSDAALQRQADILQAINEKIRIAIAPIQTLTRAQQDLVIGYQALGLSNQEIGIKIGRTARSIDAFEDSLEHVNSRMDESERAGAGARDAIGKLDLGYIKATQSAGLLRKAQLTLTAAQANDFTGGPTLESLDTIAKFNKHAVTLGDITDRNSGTMKRFRDEIEKTGGAAATTGDFLAQAFRDIPQILQRAFEGGGNIVGALTSIGIQMADAITKPIIDKLNKIQKAAIGAGASLATAIGGATGGGAGAAIAGTTSAIAGAALATTGLGAAAATSIGASVALGAATAGIGIAAIGAYYGLKKLLGGDGDWKNVNDARDDFVATAGGLDLLNKRADAAGLTLNRFLDARKPEAYKAAIDQLNAAFEFQDASMQFLDDTVQKYGFSIEELGPKFAQQNLTQQAFALEKEFRGLEAAGIDVGIVSNHMADAINAYFQAAIKTGSEVPESMRGILHQLVVMGKLTDENGDTIADLEATGVKFSKTLDERFGDLVDTINKLVDAITRGLGGALNNIPKPPTIHIPVEYDFQSPGLPNFAAAGGLVAPSGIVPIQHFASGGRVLPFLRRGTDTVPIMATPGEVILNKEQQAEVRAALGGGGSTTVIDIDGLRRDLAAQAIRTEDAIRRQPQETARAVRDVLRKQGSGVRR